MLDKDQYYYDIRIIIILLYRVTFVQRLILELFPFVIYCWYSYEYTRNYCSLDITQHPVS
jgi:hypothetical protein